MAVNTPQDGDIYSYATVDTTNYVHPRDPHLNDLHNAMDYDPYGQPVLRIDDTTSQHTSKNRLKVSNQELQYFNTFQYGRDTKDIIATIFQLKHFLQTPKT